MGASASDRTQGLVSEISVSQLHVSWNSFNS